MTVDQLITAARQQADRDVTQGIHDLETAIGTAPEWGRRDRSATPERAQLQGMLNHLQHSLRLEHAKKAT